MEIRIRDQSIILQEYLIKGMPQPKIPDTRFFYISKYPPLDNSDLLENIFNSTNGRHRSKEFIDHIIWALRFNSMFPTTISTESFNTKTYDYIGGLLKSPKELDGKKDEVLIYCCKYVPIYFWGFSFIWKNSNKSARKNAFKHYERLWERDDFDAVKQWSFSVYEIVLNRINKHIYKKIHNQMTRAERRLFLLFYTRNPLLDYRILNQEPVMKGFLRLPEVAKLCYFYFVHRINKINKRNIPEFLSLYFRSYLSFYPLWNFVVKDNDPTKYLHKKQDEHHISPSKEIYRRDECALLPEDKFPFINGPSIDENRLISFCNNFLNRQEQNILFEHLNGSSQVEIANKHQLSQQLVSKRIKASIEKIREQFHLENYPHNNFENDIGSYARKEIIHLLEKLTGTLEFALSDVFRQSA